MRKFEIMILDSVELNRKVRIYVKLPKRYHDHDMSYPVLYIHDGQVAFNDYEINETSWGLLESYLDTQTTEVILIGIASPDTRVDELCPFEIDRGERGVIGGKTSQYFEFITNSLIPTVNKTYRTKEDSEHTGMLGISLGGMCTIYAMIKLQDYFTRFAFISSAHHRFHSELKEQLITTDLDKINRVYSDVGTKENEKETVSKKYLDTNKDLYQLLSEKMKEGTFSFKVIENSRHEFKDWNTRIPDLINFLFEKK